MAEQIIDKIEFDGELYHFRDGDAHNQLGVLEEDIEDLKKPKYMIGATADGDGEAGIVPAPRSGDQDKFLKADGSYSIPENTTYETVSVSSDGLMKKEDKVKLDGIDTIGDTSTFTINSDGSISENINGKTITTSFNSDGSMNQSIVSNVGTTNIKVTFTENGYVKEIV